MSDLHDLAQRPDVHGQTARAMLYTLSLYADQLRADFAADDASTVPLLGDRASWCMPIIADGSAKTPDDLGTLEVCVWRRDRDPHCQCFRCGSQGIELSLARAIVAPCKREGCGWCSRAGDEARFADGIVAEAKRIAAGKTAPSRCAGRSRRQP